MQNGVSALRIVQTFTSSTKMKRQQLEKLWNVRCDLWGILWLFQASWQRREWSQFLIILVGKKSPRVTAAQCSAIFLPVPYFSTLSPFVLSFWPSMFCPSPSTVPPPFTSVYSSLLSLLSLFQCLLAAFPGCSLQYFTELCASVAQIVGKKGGGLCQCSRCHFSSFSFVRWRFNPFLTLHFHMLRQQSRVAAFHFFFFFFENEVFVTGM